jgi:hypothetical protein
MEHTVLAPAINQYPFPKELANSIVEMAKQTPKNVWAKSGIGHEDDVEQTIRTSKSLNMREIFPFWDDEVRKITVPAINHYSKVYESPITQDEGYNLLHYGVNNKYDFHADAGWGMYRTTSILLYLNPTDYEGGETFFKEFDIKVKPSEPSIVLFPSNYAYLHAALPVTEGEKVVLVSWMNDMPNGFGPGTMYELARLTGRL